MSKMSRSMLEAMDRFVLENMMAARDARQGQRRGEDQNGRDNRDGRGSRQEQAQYAAPGHYN
jgi:hypothetical protein